MQRGRRRRGKSGGPPRPREQIRLRHGPVSAGTWPRQIRRGRVEPFSFRLDKTLPGTLHHSGNRPAPPSDHTPLVRRSAFRRGRCGNSDARAGLERIPREDVCRAAAWQFASRWKMELCGFAPVVADECEKFSQSQERRIHADEVGNRRDSGSGNFDLIRLGKTEARLALLDMRRVKDRSQADAPNAPTDVLIWIPRGYSRPAPSQASNRMPTKCYRVAPFNYTILSINFESEAVGGRGGIFI
jgi:hypothetical protein